MTQQTTGYYRAMAREVMRSSSARVGMVTLAVVLVAVVVGPALVGDPAQQDYSAVLLAPSWSHPLGTDDLGRDALARLIYGGHASLLIGIASTAIATIAGVIIGLISGYAGGRTDEIFMRVMDALHAFPAIMLALAIAAALGASGVPVTVAIAVVYVPIFARLVRAETLQVRERDFILASRLLGAGTVRMVSRHVLPNVSPPVIVQASLVFSFAVLAEAGLSFLGVGVRPPASSWGLMLRTGYEYLYVAPWLAIAPGLTIFATVLALNLLGDGLRQAVDPRLRLSE